MLFKCVKCIENVVASLHWVLVSFDRGDLSWRRSGFLAKGELGVHDESRRGSLWEINQQPLEILQHKFCLQSFTLLGEISSWTPFQNHLQTLHSK